MKTTLRCIQTQILSHGTLVKISLLKINFFIKRNKLVMWAQSLNRVRPSVTPQTVAHQDPLSMEFLQARILEWVAMPSLQGIFPTQGSNPGLQHCRQILYHLTHQGQGINKTASYSNRKSSGSLVNSQLLTAGLSHIKITGDIAFLERGYCYCKEDSPLN